jgi:hypothetical protein
MSSSPSVVTVLIPLPLTYNPDAKGDRLKIEKEKFVHTMEEISKQFGGGVLHRFENDPPEGFWYDRGDLYRDVLAFLEVDIPDIVEAREWLHSYAKTILTARFQQEAVYLKFIGPMETVVVRP